MRAELYRKTVRSILRQAFWDLQWGNIGKKEDGFVAVAKAAGLETDQIGIGEFGLEYPGGFENTGLVMELQT